MKNWKLRPWSPADLDSLVKYANNINVSKFLMNRFPHPYSRNDGQRFIEMATGSDPVQIFAIEVNGEAAGGIGLHPQPDVFCKSLELGYWLAEPFWGQGIVPEAVREMVKYGFETFDVVRIFARPFSNNPATQRVLEKAGFELEGRLKKAIFKNGEVLDEFIYAVTR
jgi:RimJ/RimL family protein N-acetyltransferase